MVQMPALNTPQWVKSRLPRKPQPVPPIYQPEVAARAILYASHHPRRELFVGMPTVEAIIGNRVMPGLPSLVCGGLLALVIAGCAAWLRGKSEE